MWLYLLPDVWALCEICGLVLFSLEETQRTERIVMVSISRIEEWECDAYIKGRRQGFVYGFFAACILCGMGLGAIAIFAT